MPTKQRFPAAIAPQVNLDDLVSVDALIIETDSRLEGIAAAEVDIADEAKFVEIIASRFTNARLTASAFEDLSMVDVIFDNCDLSGVNLLRTKLSRVQFNECRMSGFDASGLKARDVTFNNCKLDDANFRMSSWERCQFIECQLQGAEFTAAKMKQSQLIRCNLERVQFAQAKLNDLALHGSTFEGIGGAESLRGAVIASEQVLPLLNQMLTSLGIEVDDEALP